MRVTAGSRNPFFRKQWAAWLISQLLSAFLTLIFHLRQQWLNKTASVSEGRASI